MKGMKSCCLLLVEKTIWHQANTIESLALNNATSLSNSRTEFHHRQLLIKMQLQQG
jgi:hypothetical protein